MGRNHPGENHLGRTRNRGETTRIPFRPPPPPPLLLSCFFCSKISLQVKINILALVYLKIGLNVPADLMLKRIFCPDKIRQPPPPASESNGRPLIQK